MEVVISSRPLIACSVSLLAIVPILLSRRRPNLREGWTFLAGFIKLGIVLSMLPVILEGKVIEWTFWEIIPGLALAFRVDGLGMLFALVASTLWIATSVYSTGYMRRLKEHSQTRFFVFFAVALSATLGVAFSANLLTMYLFYEVLSLATYPLVTHHQDREARSGGRTYLTYLLGTSVAFALPAMIYSYLKTGGSLDFASGGFLAGYVTGGEAAVLMVLFVFGFSKAGLMPFHSWLPAAMVAPTPVSALLHAVAVVKVGVFCVLRVFTGVFGMDFLSDVGAADVIVWLASITILTASLIALTQDNLKRRLAFSTISQLSYIILGAAMISGSALTGSIMHIAMHAMGKITLFFCAGAIFVASGKKYVSQLNGIGWHMPFTMSAYLLGALSIIGLPPLGGAWSKWFLFVGSMESGNIILTLVLAVSSLLNIAYLLPIAVRAFYLPPENGIMKIDLREAPAACVIPLMATALGSLALFLFPEIILTLAKLMGGSQ